MLTDSVMSRRPIALGSAGVAAAPPQTLSHALRRTVSRHGGRLALRCPGGATYTWAEHYAECMRFGRACIASGFQPRSGVAISGGNAPSWLFANLGAILAGGVTAGIYASNSPAAARYVVEHAGATIVVCEGAGQLAKFLERGGGGGSEAAAFAAGILAIVVYEVSGEAAVLDASLCGPRIFSWEAFLALGDGADAEALQLDLERRIAAQSPEDVVSLVYTSGTIAMPKACMLSHDNIIFVASSVLDRVSADENERMVSYLPLSHIAAALLDLYGPAIVGYSVYFATADALKGALVDTLKEVQPTVFIGVPRVFEKMQEKMLAVAANAGWAGCCLRGLSRWAKAIGLAAHAAEESGGPPPSPFALGLARLLVFRPVRAALGLSACRLIVSAAAPLQPATLSYFASLGLSIHEVYGLSESCGPATLALPLRRSGTCGRSLPGMEVSLAPLPAELAAERGGASSSGAGAAGVDAVPLGCEGEVCLRGRHIMCGYKDDAAANARIVADGGWLRTGDIGVLDGEGNLRIVGRIKELLKTAGGENVAPVLIEDAIRVELPALSQAIVIGDRRKFLSVLFALRCRVDAAGTPTDALESSAIAELRAAGSSATTLPAAAACPAVRAHLTAGLMRANKRAHSSACVVQKWRLLPRDLSTGGGELTATLKLRRAELARLHAALIESMYSGDSA